MVFLRLRRDDSLKRKGKKMNIERQIEFDKVKEIWAELAVTDLTMVEKLDFIFSKGKLSLDMDAAEPTINTERRIKLLDARHPLMDRAVAVPLQFEVGGYLYE